MAQPAAPTGPDLMVYVHAFRRHWLMAVGIGLLCAAIVGPAVWFRRRGQVHGQFLSPRGHAGEADRFPTPTPAGSIDRDRFEIYKNTQQQLVLSRFVLIGRAPQAGGGQASRDSESRDGDPVDWLANRMSVSFPGKAEIMEVSMTRDDPRRSHGTGERGGRRLPERSGQCRAGPEAQRLSELDRAFVEKETDVRAKREDLKKMAEQLGTSDTETLTLKQKLALEELTIYRQEMAKMQFELRQLQSELAAQQAVLDGHRRRSTSTTPTWIMLVQNDPIARQLFIELGWRKMDQIVHEGRRRSGRKSNYADRFTNRTCR